MSEEHVTLLPNKQDRRSPPPEGTNRNSLSAQDKIGVLGQTMATQHKQTINLASLATILNTSQWLRHCAAEPKDTGRSSAYRFVPQQILAAAAIFLMEAKNENNCGKLYGKVKYSHVV